MTSNSSVNYKYSYFEHPVLTTIRGEPTYETLHHIKKELKANTISVLTTLGGGNHGYLGMVLTPAEYRRISPNDPFTQLPNPGVLVPNPNGTAAQITIAENNHRLTKTLFRDSTPRKNLHPKNNQGQRHQIYRRPSQPRHRVVPAPDGTIYLVDINGTH